MVIQTKSNQINKKTITSDIDSVILVYLNQLVKELSKEDWSIQIKGKLYLNDKNFATTLIGFNITQKIITFSTLDLILYKNKNSEPLSDIFDLHQQFWMNQNFTHQKNGKIDSQKIIQDILNIIPDIYVDDNLFASKFKFWRQVAINSASDYSNNILSYIFDSRNYQNADLFLKDLLVKNLIEYSKYHPLFIQSNANKFYYDLDLLEKNAPGIVTKQMIGTFVRYFNNKDNQYYHDKLFKIKKYTLSIFKFFIKNYKIIKENFLENDYRYKENLLLLTTILFLVELYPDQNTIKISPKISEIITKRV